MARLLVTCNGVSFQCDKFLGKGGAATCYRATKVDSDDQTACAIKIVTRGDGTKFKDTGMIEKEQRMLMALDHPNIVRGLLCGKDSEINCSEYYMVMELGGTALDQLRLPFSVKRTHHVTSGVTRALAYLHGLGIIHNDIKPRNILVKGESIKVCDLGLSVDTRTDLSPGMRGTPNYISPEHLKGGKIITVQTDMWSLGATIFFMLTHRAPFEVSKNIKATYSNIKMCSYNSTLITSLQWRVWTNNLLQLHPDKRYTAPEFLTILEENSPDEAPPAESKTKPRTKPRRSERLRRKQRQRRHRDDS